MNLYLNDLPTGKLGASLEIRAYSPYVVAEVRDAGDGSEDDRFRTLAKVRARTRGLS